MCGRHDPGEQHLGHSDHRDHGRAYSARARARHPLVEPADSGAAGRGDRHALDLASAIDTTMALHKRVGKTPVHVKKDVAGFVGNRLQHALWREAIALVERGICDAETVDTVIKAAFGRRLAVLGPLENADLVGTDLTLAIHDTVLPEIEAGRVRLLISKSSWPTASLASSPAKASGPGRLSSRLRCAPECVPAQDGAPDDDTGDRSTEKETQQCLSSPTRSIITCAITGAIHTPTMSDALPITPDQIADAGDRRRRGGRRDPAPARARPQERPALARPGGVRAVPAAHQAELRRGHQHHDRRQPHHDLDERLAAAPVFAGDVLAQHGLDEFRPLPTARRYKTLEVRLGEALYPHTDELHLPQHLPHIERISSARRARHQVRARVLRRRPPLQSRPLHRPGCSSRRSSCSSSSASSAASAPTSTT